MIRARLLPFLPLAFACAVACSHADRPALQPTIEPLTPASTRAVVDPSVREGTATPSPHIGACPDPHVTPISTAVASTNNADETPDATLTPIRIEHPLAIPSSTASVTTSRTPTRVPPPTPHADTELETLIRDRLGTDALHYAVVIESLRDGRFVSIDADRVFYAASIFKLEVMYEVFHQRELGLLDFREQYVASDYYSGFDVGPHRIGRCDSASVGDLLSAMMAVSDNVAAVMLQDRAGAGNVNNAMATLGLQQTRLTEDGSLPATASDIARLLSAIATGDAVSTTASKAMVDLMLQEETNDRVPAELPSGARVAHKAGSWDNATHDAAIVYGSKGVYVVVLMSDLPFGGDAERVEADIAKIAFDYFER